MSASCREQIEFGALLDYWLDQRPDGDVQALEEHLLACASCSARLQGIVALGAGIRLLAGEGACEVVVTPSFLAQAARRGLRTREYRVPAGGRVDCTVTRQDELVFGRLQADLTGVSRLDVLVQTEGRRDYRIDDVPLVPGSSELIVAQAMPALRALGACRTRMRLLSREAGRDRLIGEYTFDHRPPE